MTAPFRTLCIVLLLLMTSIVTAADKKPNSKAAKEITCPAPDAAALRHWQDMRFGMFIHWGPVSLTGHEIGWSRGRETPIDVYDNLYKKFNPTKFDADQWVAIAKAAGMKYIVLTTKHHDGFCLWDTKQTDFNIMNSPFGRDVVKELSVACKRQGIAFGTYYSVCDWHHPDFSRTSPGGKVKRKTSDIEAYRRYLRAQVTELISKYGPLSVMWFDVPQEFDRSEGLKNVLLCRSLQENIIVNNRAGGGIGDYATPEQRIGGFDMERPWETCMTIARQWAWKPNDKMKTLDECMRALILAAAGNGNLLFNVGPMPNGQIEPRQAQRLEEMGNWLAKYGESIYGTRGGPYKPSRVMASTHRGDTIYLHILKWPDDVAVLELAALPAKIINSRLLTGGHVEVTQSDDGLQIAVPESDRKPIDTIIVLQLDQSASAIDPIAPSGYGVSLTEGKKAKASNVFQNSSHHNAAKAVDGDDMTRWATDGSVGDCSLEVDLGKPVTFDHALINECVDFGVRVKAFQLQHKNKEGEQWKTFCRGTTIGANMKVKFPPVTARYVRLEIEGHGGPTIYEFSLFAPSKKK